jgi:hypothetical protein
VCQLVIIDIETMKSKVWPPIAKDLGLIIKSTKINKGKRGFERGIDKLPEAIDPLALTWRRGTSMEVSWRVDSQDFQETSNIRRTLR